MDTRSTEKVIRTVKILLVSYVLLVEQVHMELLYSNENARVRAKKDAAEIV